MKSFFVLLFCALSFSALHGQSEQTLFNKSKIRGGFGGPTFSYGQIKGNSGFGSGGGGGLIVNQTMLGAFGQGELFNIHRDNAQDGSLALGYGGLWLGYSFPTQKAVHAYTSLKIGVGAVGTSEHSHWWDDDDPEFSNYDEGVLVLMPEAGVELNLFHWMRLAGTIGYRYIDGFEGALGLNKNALNAPVFGLTMKFGWFGHRKSEEKE